jgi:uncharacterized membrane protein
MRKGRTGLSFIVGVVAWIVGIVLYGVGGGVHQASLGQLTSGTSAMLSVAAILVAVGAVLLLISWISALVRTLIIGRWGWFLFVLIIGLLVMPIAMLIYLIAAADHRHEVRRPMAPAG